MKNLTLLIKPAAGLCNMNCSYCFYSKASEGRENEIMTKDTVDMLIKKICEYKPSALSVIFQGGEPTLCGLDFFKLFVSQTKEKVACPVSFALQTNGLLIDGDYCRFFKENNFLVGISLDGSRKTNDRYRRDKNGESVFSTVLNAISLLKKHGVDFNVLSVVDNENAADIESAYNYFKKHSLRFLQFIPYVDGKSEIKLTSEGMEAFLKKSFDLWYGDFARGNYISIRHIDNYINILMGNPPESCAMCGFCGSYFVVEANGDLYPCDFYCKDEYKLGSVFDSAPFEMNEKHAEFIEKSSLIHEQCRGCKYYALCRGGCRRDRINGYTKNKYCKAYYNFFEYAAERMEKAAIAVKYGQFNL